jgi:Skp family chaperone for outer membrane proteins
VKRIIVSAFAIALLAGVLSVTRDAWSEPGSDAAKESQTDKPHKVGLIDMAFVFKKYRKFEMLREELKAKINKSEDEAKAMQAEMGDLQKKMKEFTEGTPEFTKIEKDLVQRMAGFEGFKRQMSREFLKEESQIYLQIYNEVSSAVEYYSKKNDYTLVMRFNKDELESENPQQMLQNMNRQVVYHREEDDITQKILDLLNKRLERMESGAGSNEKKAAPAKSSGAKQSADSAEKPAATRKK